MGYGWELLKADRVYMDVGRYIDGLKNNCGMSDPDACSWTASLLRPLQGVRHVNMYLCPPIIGPFDDYEPVPDLDIQFAIESLRDAAYRGTEHYLGGLFFNKKEIITHSKNICLHKGVSIDLAPMPQCLLSAEGEGQQLINDDAKPGRVSTAAKVALIASYEIRNGSIVNYERAAAILTADTSAAGYAYTFDAETVKRWKMDAEKFTKVRAA